MRRVAVQLLLVGLIAIGAEAASQRAGDRGATPVAQALRIASPIRVDGRLDEPSWADARPIGPMAQRDPLEGQPATEETDVRILADANTLYFGIVCHDRTPAAIVSTQLTRDANLDVDDRVTIILDPFLDHRNGFFFQVNPAGARSDGQVSNNAETLEREWDGIWDAAARRTDQGWVAEVAVPFKTLRFKPDQTTWGLNIERHIKRKNENDRWASPRLNVWLGNLAEAGRLEGLADIRQGRGLDIRPFLTGGDDDGDGHVDVGLDVFKNLAPNLNASVTVNTDFAETEVDARQVNLTRFSLFFPEKRTFFQEGAGIFDVAGLAGSENLVPFFSRRIGLLDATQVPDLATPEQVPILVGAKVVGRQSGYNIGLLDVQTRDLPDNPLTGQNLLAARVSRNLFRQSWVGGIATRGNPVGTGENTLVGADARLATSTFHGEKNLAMNLFVLGTQDHAAGRGYAGGFGFEYPNDRWELSLNWKHIGDRFQPALGFVPRAGIRRTDARVAFQPRPGRWGIRQFFFEFEPEYVTNLQNRLENWRIFTAPFNTRTESGEHLEWNYIPEFEHLDQPFEIHPGVVIPAGSYQWTRYRAEANTATKRPWVVDFTVRYGGFYNGRRRQINAGLTWKPGVHLLLAVKGERNDISLVQGGFYTQVLEVREESNFSPNVSWANLVQFDNESRILGLQSRFRWILKPGNDLFLVVNRGWFRGFDGAYTQSFDRASTKFQYTVRL